MLASREACVDYMMPLGLHHIFRFDHHYGPEPDGYRAHYRADWNPVFYHRADSVGVGIDRTSHGTGATAQYREPYRSMYDSLDTCPEELLLWFHRVRWDYVLRNGLTLADNLALHYRRGVQAVEGYADTWRKSRPYINGEEWQHVDSLLGVQLDNAREWRDTCLGYFSRMQGVKQ